MRAYGSTLAGGPVAGEGVPLPANTAPTGELEALRARTPRAPATPWNRTARRTRASGTCADCGTPTARVESARCRACAMKHVAATRTAAIRPEDPNMPVPS